MATPDELLDAVDEVLSDGVRRGMLHNDVEDAALDGRHVTIDGRRMVNFGSCSYLGLETHPALRAVVRDALDRMWPVLTPQRLLDDLLGDPCGDAPSRFASLATRLWTPVRTAEDVTSR